MKQTICWRKVLHRVAAVIRFLSVRGLALRGDNEHLGSVHNGNFLGIMELLGEIDDFTAEHLRLHGNKGRDRPSYLPSTICNEFISLMAKQVVDFIIKEVGEAKYFGISVDSTPDISH